ncbi:phBC6A51 family helix-turn-helix protein [Paenibacillus pinihumi]|uniref:phBC6A51 family helix-turn-helix protein n=1 Tax=Paenibacillus pinihumi TaxID=669462 RepID=UPI00040A1B2C|nr:phBC6A51 family helix-turn-helix protein [Paenibacillus pinihumi]
MSAAKRKQLESRLDGRQKIAALAVVERDFAPEDERKGFEEIAAEVGVSRNTLYEWRTQNKAFIDYANSLADDFLTGKRSLVYRKLMQLIDSSQPSVKAIDLFMKREGLITAQVAVETKDAGASRSNEELAAEIAEIDELLAED